MAFLVRKVTCDSIRCSTASGKEIVEEIAHEIEQRLIHPLLRLQSVSSRRPDAGSMDGDNSEQASMWREMSTALIRWRPVDGGEEFCGKDFELCRCSYS